MATQNFRVKNGLEVGSGVTITSGGNITAGIVSATSFFGDGSGLSNFSGGGESYWVETSAGIHTLSKVGIGTTNPETALSIYYGVLSFDGKDSGYLRSDISIGNSTTNSANSAFIGQVFPQNNIFIGNKVFENKTGLSHPGFNIVIGDSAGNTLGDGCQENVIIGVQAGYVNEGNGNNFIGMRAGESNLGGYLNNFIGYDVGYRNTTGSNNNFIGHEAGYSNITGNNNVFIGEFSGYFNQEGVFNTSLGNWSANGFGGNVTNQNYNIHLGAVNGGTIGGSYQVLIGSGNATGNRYFDLPSPNKSYQFAVGIRTDANASRYWLVGDENFNVGIGTTNPTSKLTVKGNTSLETLNVSGVSTFSGNVLFEQVSGSSKYIQWDKSAGKLNFGDTTQATFGESDDLRIFHNNVSNERHSFISHIGLGNLRISSGPNGSTEIQHNATTKLETIGAGVTITGTTFTNQLSVSGVSTLGTVQVSSGIVTATSGTVTYYGDTSNTTDGRWTLGASGTSDYTFTGIGFTQTTNDPVLYLARGRVYEFVNNSGGSHPFEIRVSNGGAAYNNGVTNNGSATGTIRFEVTFNAPNTLYYQCTNHSSMGNTINVYPSI